MYWYLKSNVEEWHDNLNDLHHLDWAGAAESDAYEEGVLYTCTHTKRTYFQAARMGDVVLLHSSKDRSSRKDGKFTTKPRLVGLGKIARGLHSEPDRVKREGPIDYILIDIIHIFREQIPLAELLAAGLEQAEPFAKGTRRQALSRLEPDEYERIKQLILERDPAAADEFRKVE